MGLSAGGRFFAENVQNALQRDFERGVGGLHGMQKRHLRPVARKPGVVEAPFVAEAGRIPEMTAGGVEIVVDLDPARPS